MGWIFHFYFIFIETFPLITWLHHELMNVELSLFDVQIRCLIKLSLGYYKDVVSTNPYEKGHYSKLFCILILCKSQIKSNGMCWLTR